MAPVVSQALEPKAALASRAPAAGSVRVAIAVSPSEREGREFRGILTAQGISVRYAGSVWEALLANADADVILYDTDAQDPWQTALTVFHRRWPDCPVILVSRLADERLWIEALAAGVHDLLAKPFLPLELNSVVRSVLLRSADHGART